MTVSDSAQSRPYPCRQAAYTTYMNRTNFGRGSGSEPPDGSWIAVQVWPGREQAVRRSLEVRGYATYLPVSATRANQNRVLFSGYVFCRYRQQAVARIVEVRGALRLVSFDGRVSVIREGEIAALRQIEASEIENKSAEYMVTGDLVQVIRGPLQGLNGFLVQGDHLDTWIVVSINLLKRSVHARVALTDVRKYLQASIEDDDEGTDAQQWKSIQ